MNIETTTRKPMALRRRLLWPLAALLTAAGLSRPKSRTVRAPANPRQNTA